MATPKKSIWAGRIISGVVVLFLVFDGVTKFIRPIPAPVAEAFGRLGLAAGLASTIGIVVLVCTAVCLIPHTSILGAILLTGYLGGAVAIHLRASSPVFETLFPVVFGALVWLGLYLRDNRLHAVIPLRRWSS